MDIFKRASGNAPKNLLRQNFIRIAHYKLCVEVSDGVNHVIYITLISIAIPQHNLFH